MYPYNGAKLVMPLVQTQIFNQFTSGILYFFQSPRTGLFSVKIRKKFLAINICLSMKLSPDNQINASSLTFRELIYGHLSSAQLLGRWQAPKQRASIDQRPGRTDSIHDRDQRQ